MKKPRSLPKEVLIRWNTDGDEPYLELSEKVNDICMSPGDESVWRRVCAEPQDHSTLQDFHMTQTPTEQRAPINLAELERLAKAAQADIRAAGVTQMVNCDASVPMRADVVLRLVAALRQLREYRPYDFTEHGITDEATP